MNPNTVILELSRYKSLIEQESLLNELNQKESYYLEIGAWFQNKRFLSKDETLKKYSDKIEELTTNLNLKQAEIDRLNNLSIKQWFKSCPLFK